MKVTVSSSGEQLTCTEHYASLLLRLGVIFAMLAIVPRSLFGTCMCNAPKELILHLTGLGAAALCLFSIRKLSVGYTDICFCAFLLLSVLSGIFAATDRWESLRAVGLSISAAAVFWSARHLASVGERQRLLRAVTLAVVVVMAGVLLDAFGLLGDLAHAKPGGTQGNRNWAAHLIALGMPLIVFLSLRTQHVKCRAIELLAVVLVTVALIVTRSRAAWLAVAFGTFIPLVVLVAVRRFGGSRSAAALMLGAMVAGVILGVYAPTRLDWTGPNPYLATAKDIAAYDRGSGLGRVIQYRKSLAMAADHPGLGVGPGNWKVVYQNSPHSNRKSRRYPSLFAKFGPFSPGAVWSVPTRPNSDWIAIIAERGIPAGIFWLAALIAMAIPAVNCLLRSETPGEQPRSKLEMLAMLGVLIALEVAGSFDSVVQLPAPAYLSFLALGALSPHRGVIELPLRRASRVASAIGCLLLSGVLSIYTIDEIYGAQLIARSGADDRHLASVIAFDPRWYHTQVVWHLRASGVWPGMKPGCD